MKRERFECSSLRREKITLRKKKAICCLFIGKVNIAVVLHKYSQEGFWKSLKRSCVIERAASPCCLNSFLDQIWFPLRKLKEKKFKFNITKFSFLHLLPRSRHFNAQRRFDTKNTRQSAIVERERCDDKAALLLPRTSSLSLRSHHPSSSHLTYSSLFSDICSIPELRNASFDALLSEMIAAEWWHKCLIHQIQVRHVFRERTLKVARLVQTRCRLK